MNVHLLNKQMSRLTQSLEATLTDSKQRTDAKMQQYQAGLASLAAANQQAAQSMTRIENLLTEANN